MAKRGRLTNEEKRYIAGVIDGEGCIFIGRSKNGYLITENEMIYRDNLIQQLRKTRKIYEKQKG